MIANTEQIEAVPAAIVEPKAAKKARVGKRGGHVAAAKAKTGKKAISAKKAPRTRKGENKAVAALGGNKTAQVLELLKRAGGVTAGELMKTTGWQSHSVRGFLSGTVRKKMGLTVTSNKAEDGERTYSIKG